MNMRNLLLKVCGTMASFAFVIAAFSAQVTCSYYYHQPEMPDSVKKLKKF